MRGPAAALAALLLAAPAMARDLPLETCAALGLPSSLTPYEEPVVALPEGDGLDWGALLMLEGRDLPLPTFAEGAALRIGVPPVPEGRARLVLGARGPDGEVALCPPHRIRVEAPPARAGAWLEWTGQVATLAARAGGVAEALGGAPILPEDLTEAVLSDLAGAQAAYDGLAEEGRRALDAYATFQLGVGRAGAGLSSLLYLKAQTAAADPISAPGRAPEPAPAIWRPAEHPARLWRAQVGGLKALQASCPGSVEDLIAYRKAVHEAEIWQGGTYADFKRGLEATGTFLVSAGAGLVGGAGAAEAVNTGLSTGIAAQGILSDWAIGMVPSDLVGLEVGFTGGPVFEDSPEDRREVRLDPITLKTRSRGWDVSKAALDTTLAAVGPFAGKLKAIEAGEIAEAGRIAAAKEGFVTADEVIGDLARLRQADPGIFDTVWGIEEGKRLGDLYSGVQKNVKDSTISYPPISCELDIADSDIWTSEVVDLPGGNALRAVDPSDPQERDFRARKAGRGAVMVEIDPARLYVPASVPTATARMSVPEIRLVLTGPGSIPAGGTGEYEARVEGAAFPDLIEIDWETVTSGAVAWAAQAHLGLLGSTDECEPGGATIFASPKGDFLEDSDAETREVRTLAVSVVVPDDCEEEEPAEEEPVLLSDLSSPASCGVQLMGRPLGMAVHGCQPTESMTMRVPADGAFIELTNSGGTVFRFDRTGTRMSEVPSPLTSQDRVEVEIRMDRIIARIAGPGEAAAFAAADPILYETLDPEQAARQLWRAFAVDGALYVFPDFVDLLSDDGAVGFLRSYIFRYVLDGDASAAMQDG